MSETYCWRGYDVSQPDTLVCCWCVSAASGMPNVWRFPKCDVLKDPGMHLLCDMHAKVLDIMYKVAYVNDRPSAS